MKRTEALASLSRDHHQALVVAMHLRRADEGTRASARDGFLDYWREHGRIHFQLEEQILLPDFSAFGDAHDPLVLQVLGQHVEIRHRADVIEADPQAPVALLAELGELLATHVRLEERELFPKIEQLMPDDDLIATAERLERAETAERGS